MTSWAAKPGQSRISPVTKSKTQTVLCHQTLVSRYRGLLRVRRFRGCSWLWRACRWRAWARWRGRRGRVPFWWRRIWTRDEGRLRRRILRRGRLWRWWRWGSCFGRGLRSRCMSCWALLFTLERGGVRGGGTYSDYLWRDMLGRRMPLLSGWWLGSSIRISRRSICTPTSWWHPHNKGPTMLANTNQLMNKLTAQAGRLVNNSFVASAATTRGTKATRKGTIHFILIDKRFARRTTRVCGPQGIFNRFPLGEI